VPRANGLSVIAFETFALIQVVEVLGGEIVAWNDEVWLGC
jgi:hypothetical protein